MLAGVEIRKQTMTTLAILQARLSSTRLPGKVLLPILGIPMLLRQIERINRATTIDKLIVATSVDKSDDPLEAALRTSGIPCFRGNLADVLDRFYKAALPYKPAHVVRLTGDCPLADPQVIDTIVAEHIAGRFDYTSNTITPTYPDGLDAEVVTFAALETGWRAADLQTQREHVTPFFKDHPDLFSLGDIRQPTDQSAMRWTVDTAEDFAVVRAVYEQLYPDNPRFTTADVIRLLAERPELSAGNAGQMRDASYHAARAAEQAAGLIPKKRKRSAQPA